MSSKSIVSNSHYAHLQLKMTCENIKFWTSKQISFEEAIKMFILYDNTNLHQSWKQKLTAWSYFLNHILPPLEGGESPGNFCVAKFLQKKLKFLAEVIIQFLVQKFSAILTILKFNVEGSHHDLIHSNVHTLSVNALSKYFMPHTRKTSYMLVDENWVFNLWIDPHNSVGIQCNWNVLFKSDDRKLPCMKIRTSCHC